MCCLSLFVVVVVAVGVCAIGVVIKAVMCLLCKVIACLLAFVVVCCCL